MIQLEILNTTKGENKIFIEDTNPEERVKLAQHVKEMLKQGFFIFLTEKGGSFAHRVVGYDDERNEWIVLSPPTQPIPVSVANATTGDKSRRRPYRKRQYAGGTTAVGVALTAGG